MIEDTKFVEKIESKPGGKSGTYWAITWTDGKTDRIFNGDWLPICEESQEKKLAVHFTKQKEGNYYNIKSMELVRDALPEPKEPQTPPPQKDEPEPPTESSHYAPQEIGMWMKELGEAIRSGQLEKDFPNSHVKIKSYYYKIMSEVTNIPFK
jgi:hypothetical protein